MQTLKANKNCTDSFDGSNKMDGCFLGTEGKRKPRNIFMWNVRGLNSLGKLSILGNELDRLDVTMCGLSETKWSGSGHNIVLITGALTQELEKMPRRAMFLENLVMVREMTEDKC